MKRKIGPILLALSFLTACQSVSEDSISSINLDNGGINLLFFSNKDHEGLEENYYDVLLDLRKEFPKEMANLYLVQASKSAKTKQYAITTYPTLIVVNNGKEIERIEGEQSKQEIINRLTKALK